MFDELSKYKQSNHFFINGTEKLSKVCNAPNDKSGIYIVYALAKGRIDLIYIGRSGKKKDNGEIFIRKAGLGGIKDRIVNGHQFGKIPRNTSWLSQMKIENIEALDVYWYVTHDDDINDCPSAIESQLIKKYLSIYGQLPRWNKI